MLSSCLTQSIEIARFPISIVLSTFSSSPTPSFFFFNDTATPEIYTLSLHDALPISSGPLSSRTAAQPSRRMQFRIRPRVCCPARVLRRPCGATASPANRPFSVCHRVLPGGQDRKSTRLNSSHDQISYAVFCLNKKKLHEACADLHHVAAPALHARGDRYGPPQRPGSCRQHPP